MLRPSLGKPMQGSGIWVQAPRAEGALLCPPGAAHVVPCDLVPGRHLGTHNVNEGP